MKRLLLATVCLLFLSPYLHSQLLTWTPDFAKDNDNIVITMDATKGNQGLLNYTPATDVYVHIGVITSSSTNSSDWRYSKFTWATTPSLAQATYMGSNKWQYTVTNIRAFFNAPSGVPAGETIQKIAILFRNGAGSVVQRNADASDMYIPVYDNGLAVRFSVPPFEPRYIPIPETINKVVGDNINVTGIANQTSDMKVYLNGTVIQTAIGVSTLSANPALTVPGNTEIVVEAMAATVTKKDTLRFFVTPGVTVAPLPAGARDGINYAANNTEATLVLYAPGKNRVSVIGEFAGSNWLEQSQYVMNKTPDGNYWWLKITGLTAGTEYAFQYLVDGNLKIAEPYAEKILDPYNNNDQNISAATYPGLRTYPAGQTGIVSLLQTASVAYNWQVNNFQRPDKRTLVTYELLVRDFVAAHDWKTVRDSLNYLKTLGVNAIEIMPFNEFEGNESWGYNPDFYFAPDKYYGPKNTLKEFIDSCHKKGMAVIMDIALNHSFGLSPMVQLYFDAANNRPAANNPWFNPVPKHAFNVGYDMNHESLATRYFVSRVVEHWLTEYKIDGFRFDLSKGFTQVQTCDASGNNCNVNNWGNYDASRVAIWKRYYDTLQLKSPGSYAVLEHFAADAEEIELSDYGMLLWGNSNYNYNEASMGFISTSNFERAIHSVRNWTQPYLMSYMESHDEERLMYKNLNFGNSSGSYNTRDLNTALKRMELNAAFFLTIPGPKMIWQFGELGYDFSINRCADGTINNNCRLDKKPVRWDYLQVIERRRLYDTYTSLNKLRFHPWYKDVFIANNINLTRNLSAAFKTLIIRSGTDSSMICLAGNFDVTPQSGTITFPSAGTWYDYLNGNTFTATGTAQSISLQPGEFHVYLNRNLLNAVTTPVIDINNPGNALQVVVYPNPVQANSVTEIYVPERGYVQADLWNIHGQKAQVVFTGTLAKGKHTISLSAKTNNLPPGMYLLKVQSKNKTVSIKILLQ